MHRILTAKMLGLPTATAWHICTARPLSCIDRLAGFVSTTAVSMEFVLTYILDVPHHTFVSLPYIACNP